MCYILYLSLAIVTIAISNDDEPSSPSTETSIAAKAVPPFSYDVILPLIKTGTESMGLISIGLQKLDLDDAKKLVDPFNKSIVALAAIYQQLRVFRSIEYYTKPVEVEMQQRLATLDAKFNELEFVAEVIVDNVAPPFFKTDMDILKNVRQNIYENYEKHLQAIKDLYTSKYAENVAYNLGLLKDSCANNDTRSIFKEVYADLSSQLLQENIISLTNWTIADVTKMASDLFYTVSTFAMMQSVCLGVSDSVTDTEINSTLQYTTAAFSYFANFRMDIHKDKSMVVSGSRGSFLKPTNLWVLSTFLLLTFTVCAKSNVW